MNIKRAGEERTVDVLLPLYEPVRSVPHPGKEVSAKITI